MVVAGFRERYLRLRILLHWRLRSNICRRLLSGGEYPIYTTPNAKESELTKLDCWRRPCWCCVRAQRPRHGDRLCSDAVDRGSRADKYVHCGGVYCNRDNVDKYPHDRIWKEDARVDSESVPQDGSVAAGRKESLIGTY